MLAALITRTRCIEKTPCTCSIILLLAHCNHQWHSWLQRCGMQFCWPTVSCAVCMPVLCQYLAAQNSLYPLSNGIAPEMPACADVSLPALAYNLECASACMKAVCHVCTRNQIVNGNIHHVNTVLALPALPCIKQTSRLKLNVSWYEDCADADVEIS